MKKTFAAILSSVLILFWGTSYGCSAFLLKGENHCVVGFNENWKTMPGIVVLNKRNMVKESLSWKSLTSPKPIKEKTVTWESKYGSVSFNLLGIDLPCYGVNEKGLFIVELYLDKTYSKPDTTKANMFWAQWIQFQLDNYATVEEVTGNLNNSPVIDWWPNFPGSHFFVADKLGNTAAIELVEGQFKVTSHQDMPVPVLCNDPYQKELKAVGEYEFMNGAKKFDPYSKKWEDRFTKATHMLKSYDPVVSPVDYSWQVLDSIKPGQWQLVADLRGGVVYFRSDVGKEIKSLDLAACGFDRGGSLEYIDINSRLKGDVRNGLTELTADLNDSYVARGFPIGYVNKEFPESDDYQNIKANLRRYFLRLTEQKD